MTKLSAYERETIINLNDGEDIASIWTAQKKVITKLKKNPVAKLISENKGGNRITSAEFELPKKCISFRSIIKKKKPTIK